MQTRNTTDPILLEGVLDMGFKGDDGLTPYIGENGNWWIGGVDTHSPSRGPKGERGERGESGPQGPQGPKGDTGSFDDAPADGKQYARQNNAWAVIADGGVSDAYTKAESDARYQAKGNYQPAGNYATTAQLANYQPIITDLSTIRSNAALGATALQTETDPTVPSWAKRPNKPTYTAAEVGAASQAELTQLDHKVSDKQDKLIAGEGITIADDGKTISAQGGGGTADKWEVVEDITLSEPVAKYVYNSRNLKSARIIFTGGGSDTSNVYLKLDASYGKTQIAAPTLSGMFLSRYGILNVENIGGYYKSSYSQTAATALVNFTQFIESPGLVKADKITEIAICLRNMEMPAGSRIIIYGVYA